MKMIALAAVAAFGLIGAASAQSTATSKTSDLLASGGAKIGTVTVTSAPKGILLRVQASGLTPGWHGMHFHEKGDCSDAAFKNSGGHVHGGGTLVHGLLNPAASDSGDLPNLYVQPNGTATVELYTTLTTANGGGGIPALFDADGSALVIHASPDDYTSQPIGGAGARVACAVIK